MTNLAQPATSLTNNHRPGVRGMAPAPKLQAKPAQPAPCLPLTGGTPLVVNVAVTAEGNPVFWLEDPTKTFSGGIWWQVDDCALMITFVFQSSISKLRSITPGIWFSDTFGGGESGSCQMCCIPPVSGEYHFAIIDPTGTQTVIDPRIVVTPIVT